MAERSEYQKLMPAVVVVEEDEEAIEAAVVGVAVSMEVAEEGGTVMVCILSISCLSYDPYSLARAFILKLLRKSSYGLYALARAGPE